MKYIFSIIVLTTLFGVTACSLNNDDYFEVHAIEYGSDLKSTVHSFINITTLIRPSEFVNVSDNYLLVSDSGTNGFIKVFKIPELKFLYSWGSQGSGPNEFQHTPIHDINTFNGNVILYEIGSRILREYSVNDTTLSLVNETFLKYEDQHHPLSGITRVNDDLYIVENRISLDGKNHEFLALQPNNSSPLFSFANYPETELELNEKYWEYIKSIGISDDASRIAAFYYYHNKFKIFDNTGKLLNKFKVKDGSINNNEGELLNFLYRSIKSSSDSYLYLLAMNDYRDTIEENIETFRASFEKWNWDGEQLNRSRFDVPIHNFVVSEKLGKIYGYSVLDIYSIYEFDIP